MKLFIYHAPEETPTQEMPECAIAVDVLRATTTMATVLANGGEGIQFFSDLDELVKVSEKFPAHKRLRAGERGGAKVPNFDLGNSPLDCKREVVEGKRLFISTTNGTRALQRIQDAQTVITGAFVNLTSVVEYLANNKPENVWMVGSGWQGSYSLEDTACAGAIAHHLLEKTKLSIDDVTGNDEVVAAMALYSQWKDNLLQMLKYASHGKRLIGLDCNDDLKYCSQIDTFDVLPMQQEPGVLKRHV